jgi:hypothetical protein
MIFKAQFSHLVYATRTFAFVATNSYLVPPIRLHKSLAFRRVFILNFHNTSHLSNLSIWPYSGPITCESSRYAIAWILQEYYKERPRPYFVIKLKIQYMQIGEQQCFKEILQL